MSLVPVAQEKNLKNVVEAYKIIINETKIKKPKRKYNVFLYFKILKI